MGKSRYFPRPVAAVGSYVRNLAPRLPRAVWALELGGLINAFGNGFVYPFLFIYLHNVRGFALGTSGLKASARSQKGATTRLSSPLNVLI